MSFTPEQIKILTRASMSISESIKNKWKEQTYRQKVLTSRKAFYERNKQRFYCIDCNKLLFRKAKSLRCRRCCIKSLLESGIKMGFQNGHKINNSRIKTIEVRQKMREGQINKRRVFKNTGIEQKIAKELQKRDIVYQQNIGLSNIGIVDFYLPEQKIIIECDGCFYHNCLGHYPEYNKERREKDEIKTKRFIFNGFKIFRFWEHEINESPEKCLNKVFA